MVPDTTTPLFERLFLASAPYADVVSERFLETHGAYITGDPVIDKSIACSPFQTYLTIVQMAELFQKGVRVDIIKPDDAKVIYDLIEDHLRAWTTNLERGINIGNAPIEDLMVLDAFANKIYEYGKYRFERSDPITRLHNSLFKSPHLRPSLLHRPKMDDKIPERESVSEFLEQKLHEIIRW